jgi:hypothetical protein
MAIIPKDLIDYILLFSGHLVILEGKYYPIRKISQERIALIENVFTNNLPEIGWDLFDNLVRYIALEINNSPSKFYIISKYITQPMIFPFVMITNTPYVYEDD